MAGEGDIPTVEMAELLADSPPNRWVWVPDFASRSAPNSKWKLHRPEIVLWCDNESCHAPMRWEATGYDQYLEPKHNEVFVTYRCKHCEQSTKVFALVAVNLNEGAAACTKLGESPAFGPHIPSRLKSLLGDDHRIFYRGVRCESQGLGIGAFAYYRRVVESQNQRLFQAVLAAAEKLGGSQDVIDELKQASRETQFTKAVDAVKHALPRPCR